MLKSNYRPRDVKEVKNFETLTSKACTLLIQEIRLVTSTIKQRASVLQDLEGRFGSANSTFRLCAQCNRRPLI